MDSEEITRKNWSFFYLSEREMIAGLMTGCDRCKSETAAGVSEKHDSGKAITVFAPGHDLSLNTPDYRI